MKVYLKVKIKSLAAEALIIRKEEKRHKGELRASLRQHRINQVRTETRATLLAYGFLRGRPLSRIEPVRKRNSTGQEVALWKRAEALVMRYGDGDVRDRMQRFSEFKATA